MLSKVYSVRDKKTEMFNPPFYQATHGEAERSFHRLVNDPKTNINQFPEDYDLYYLGEFDDNKGQLISMDSPVHVVQALQLHTGTEAKARQEQKVESTNGADC